MLLLRIVPLSEFMAMMKKYEVKEIDELRQAFSVFGQSDGGTMLLWAIRCTSGADTKRSQTSASGLLFTFPRHLAVMPALYMLVQIRTVMARSVRRSSIW
jgi:hypothetical protein